MNDYVVTMEYYRHPIFTLRMGADYNVSANMTIVEHIF